MNASDLQKITDWLIDGARSAASPADMMSETCERLVRAGLPLWRVGVFVRTLHPDILGHNFIWRPGAEVEVGSVNFDMLDAPEFKASPLAIVFTKATEVRAHMDDAGSKRFPIVEDMRSRRRHGLCRAADPVYRRLNSRVELDHETAGRF